MPTRNRQDQEKVNRWRAANPTKVKASNRRAKIKYRAKWQKFLKAYKVEKGCMDCGFDKWYEALDFDHVRGDKLFEIRAHIVQSKSEAVIMNEIAKCEVVCANCHRHRTEQRRLND